MRAELLRANFQRRSKETSATKEQIKGTAARASFLLDALAKTLSFLLFLTILSLLKANKPRSLPATSLISSLILQEPNERPDWRSLDRHRNNVTVNQALRMLCESNAILYSL